MHFFRSLTLALGLAAVCSAAPLSALAAPWAEPVSQHPAMVPGQVLPGIDTRVHLIGHPASPTVRGAVPNHRDHPAVAAARRARDGEAALDPNTFRVLPPASTEWTAGPARSGAIALLAR